MKRMAVIIILALTLALAGCAPNKLTPSPAARNSCGIIPASPSSKSAQTTSSVPADAVELSLEDYFPLVDNVHKTYAGMGNEYAGFETWVDYLENGALQLRENNGGTEIIEVYVMEDGALKRVFSREETYFRQDFTAERDTEQVLLMEPLEIGTSWLLADGAQRSITAINAAVTVPYGTYTALEVTTVFDGSMCKDYYAPGIGLIKQAFVSGETAEPITSELENCEEGSPLRQYAHFYYPDFTNGRVAYLEKPFELITNEDIKGAFERELKTVPEGSGLTPVLPEGAALNSVTFDPATRVVKADVSRIFITEMNAGSSLEGLILQSLADTLGWYFQTDKVQLTVDGGPYESGHFLFNIGDYLPYDLDGAVAYNP